MELDEELENPILEPYISFEESTMAGEGEGEGTSGGEEREEETSVVDASLRKWVWSGGKSRWELRDLCLRQTSTNGEIEVAERSKQLTSSTERAPRVRHFFERSNLCVVVYDIR